MERQLLFFLGLIALITGAFFIYNFASAMGYIGEQTAITLPEQDNAKMTALTGGCLSMTGVFFIYVAARTKTRKNLIAD